MRSTSKIEWELALDKAFQEMYQTIDAEQLKKITTSIFRYVYLAE